MDPMEATTAPMIVVQRQPILLHTTKKMEQKLLS
jgi:hypothetical protein